MRVKEVSLMRSFEVLPEILYVQMFVWKQKQRMQLKGLTGLLSCTAPDFTPRVQNLHYGQSEFRKSGE